jgi:hypothetical protein
MEVEAQPACREKVGMMDEWEGVVHPRRRAETPSQKLVPDI